MSYITNRTTSDNPSFCRTLGTLCGRRGSAQLGDLSHIDL